METTNYTLEKEQKMLENSFDMYEKTIKGTIKSMKNKIDENTGQYMYNEHDIEAQVELLRNAQDDIINKYIQNGGKKEDLMKRKEKKGNNNISSRFNKAQELNLMSKKEFKAPKPPISTEIEKISMETNKKNIQKKSVTESIAEMQEYVASKEKEEKKTQSFLPKNYDNKTAYDVIPLPSRGQCYANKLSKVPVSFLTAYDENMIVSPNLYRDNLVLDYILENKIMNDDINPSLLLDGDREAIILYLRASGYGNEYPIMAKDDVTGEEFEAVIDLSDIKFKEFNLVGDENGYFDFELPVTKKKVKFKFLNHAEVASLDKLNEIENKKEVSAKVLTYMNDIEDYLDLMDDIPASEKVSLRESITRLRDWSESLENTDSEIFSHYLTNKLELSIVSIDGNRDREYISQFVKEMPVRDSSSLRKYILNNEPGLDYNFKIEKPASLGGGSMDVFLQFDQFIFLNIPK